MPLYNYECVQCGPFEEFRPMAAFAAPHACPQCREPAPRVLAAPRPASMDANRRQACAINEKSAHEPGVRSVHMHGPNCGCGGPRSRSRQNAGAVRKQFLDRRPWMISH
jgi:putative FmdB family regulatory protein